LKFRLYQTIAGHVMNKFVTMFIFAAMLSACSSKPAQPPFSEAPLAGAKIGAPFTLTDQNGKKRSYADDAGKFRIVYFGYTSCPDICTPDMQQLMAGLIAFEKANPDIADKVQPYFITVDPARDTPEKLKQFVEAFHPRLVGLTGTDTEIAAAAKSFAVYFQRVEGTTPDAYLMSHSQMPYLMAPDGKPLAILPADTPNTEANEGEAKLVAAELAKWVR
jgi:protein SCO1